MSWVVDVKREEAGAKSTYERAGAVDLIRQPRLCCVTSAVSALQKASYERQLSSTSF